MTEVRTDAITREVIEKALTYDEYRTLINNLLTRNKTTGENHSEAMIHYTLMNVHRMKRLDRQIKLLPELVGAVENIDRDMIWLVLTEAWCGDAAQIVPLFKKMADLNSRIDLRFILRDEHLEIMDNFLYRGKSRSIPVLIAMDAESLEMLGSWGPRPLEAQELFDDMRETPGLSYPEVAEALHKWYSDDKTESTQREWVDKLEEWNSLV